jgi:hypothetical protein
VGTEFHDGVGQIARASECRPAQLLKRSFVDLVTGAISYIRKRFPVARGLFFCDFGVIDIYGNEDI